MHLHLRIWSWGTWSLRMRDMAPVRNQFWISWVFCLLEFYLFFCSQVGQFDFSSLTFHSHATLSHTIFHHTIFHTPSLRYLHTIFAAGVALVDSGTLRGRRGNWWHPPSLRMAGVALGDIHLRFAWQAWHLWHWASSGGALGRASVRLGALGRRWCRRTLRGRRGTWWHPPSLRVAGVALATYGTGLALVSRLSTLGRAWARLVAGDAAVLCVAGRMALGDIHLRFAWQAWHLVTSTFVLRGRRGTYLGMALDWLWRRAWARLGALGRRWRRGTFTWQAWHLVISTFASHGRYVTWWHPPSFCVAGVALICTYGTGLALVARFGHAWARLVAGDAAVLCVAGVATSTFASRGRRATYGTGLALVARLGALSPPGRRAAWHGRRGTWWHLPSFCVAGVALVALGWQCGVSSHTIFDFDTPSFTHNFVTHHLWHTTLSHTLFHTPSFTHHFVTHNLSHTPSLTRHLWHTIFHITLSHTIFHTPSQTIFHTHHLSHTTLSHTIFHHTIFHTQLCHTPSFATPSFTHHFVTHHLSHTTLSHTSFFFVTHHLSHTTLSHTHNFFFTSRSSTTSFVFPSFPVPLQHLLLIIGRSWLVGLSGPLIGVCAFVSFFLCSLLFWWHRAGLMLNHVERFWAIFGYLLILLAFILDLGILVLLRFGLVGL